MARRPCHHSQILTDVHSKKNMTSLLDFKEQVNATDLVALLRPFKEATVIMSSETAVTSSLILPTMVKLQRLIEVGQEDSPLIKKVKLELAKNLSKRYTHDADKETTLIACMVDPRFKKLAFLSEEERLDARELLCRVGADLMANLRPHPIIKTEPLDTLDVPTHAPVDKPLPPLPTLALDSDIDNGVTEVVPQAAASPSEVVPVVPKAEACEPSTKKQKVDEACCLDWFSDVVLVGIEKPPEAESLEEVAAKEVDRYMDETYTRDDPLKWWATNQHSYPRCMSHLARKYLAIPASSVPSERIFSLTGNLVNKKRSQLSPENIDRLVFLNKNYKFE